MAGRRRKRVSANRGDVVAIALEDGTFGFGQVLEWTKHSVVLAVYGAGAGEGHLDVWLEVAQAQRSIIRLKRVLDELDIRSRATISVEPLEM
ncbi:MAG: hypothetical protein ABI175_21935 [Polyangiales bacterium]